MAKKTCSGECTRMNSAKFLSFSKADIRTNWMAMVVNIINDEGIHTQECRRVTPTPRLYTMYSCFIN